MALDISLQQLENSRVDTLHHEVTCLYYITNYFTNNLLCII